MAKQVTLENTLAGGFGLPTGQIVPGNGSTLVEPEVWDAAKDHPVVAARVKAGTIIVDGQGKKRGSADDRDENGDTPGEAQLRRQFDGMYKQQGDALAAAQTEVDTLNGKVVELQAQIEAKDGEITALKTGAAAQGTNDHGNDSSQTPGAFTVTDKGRGWWAITQDGKEVTKSLREDDVREFDKLSDADKAAFVDLHNAG